MPRAARGTISIGLQPAACLLRNAQGRPRLRENLVLAQLCLDTGPDRTGGRKVLRCSGLVAQLFLRHATAEEGARYLGVQLKCPVEVGDGSFRIADPQIGEAAAVE